MDKFLQLTLTGFTTGAVLALVALGFVLIYKASGVINFAQGEFLLVGAYVTFGLVAEIGVPWTVGVALTMLFAVILGVLVERLVLRSLIGEPILSVIMITIGLSSLLRAIVHAIWGTAGRPFPPFIPSQTINILGAVVPADRLIAIGLALILLAVFSLFFHYSRDGIAMRATADDQQVALSMGISVKRVFAVAWSISALAAAIAGVLVANIVGVSAAVGGIGLRVFPVVILGGLNSIPGAIIGGIIIGLLEAYTAGYGYHLGPLLAPIGLDAGGLSTVIPFIILVIILMIRPYGLFGQEIIERV